MHVITANAGPLAIDFQRGSIRPGLLVVEANVLLNEIANRLHARPAWLRVRK